MYFLHGRLVVITVATFHPLQLLKEREGGGDDCAKSSTNKRKGKTWQHNWSYSANINAEKLYEDTKASGM